jgi:hypothetical protein
VTREEHLNILTFLDGCLSGNQPAIDIEADAIIRAYFKKHPDTAYRVTMLALAQTARPPAVAERKKTSWLARLTERRAPQVDSRAPAAVS